MRKKFADAFHGIWCGLQHKAIIIQCVLAVVTVVACFLFKVTYYEWLIVLLCIGLVIMAEFLNTAIEKICDFMCEEYNEKIRVIKDLSAASVLVAAFISLVVAILIVVRHI